MTDLAEFLLARIAEDEATAQSLIAQTRWRYRHIGDAAEVWSNTDYSEEGISLSPERMLAECEAKRQLLSMADPFDFADDGGTGMSEHADKIQRLLALPYADHDEYLEEWRP